MSTVVLEVGNVASVLSATVDTNHCGMNRQQQSCPPCDGYLGAALKHSAAQTVFIEGLPHTQPQTVI